VDFVEVFAEPVYSGGFVDSAVAVFDYSVVNCSVENHSLYFVDFYFVLPSLSSMFLE
jgi:hypothetical protein